MTQVMENASAIEEEISNIVVELYDNIALLHDNNDLDELHKIIDSYIKRVTRIGFRLAKSRYSALRDSCVIFHGILDELKKQNKALTPEQAQQFEVWPTLILTYLAQPEEQENIDNILGFLQDSIWDYHVDQAEFDELKRSFINIIPNDTVNEAQAETVEANDTIPTPSTEEVASEEEEDIYADAAGAFDGAVFESIQEEILDAMTSLISDLSSTGLSKHQAVLRV